MKKVRVQNVSTQSWDWPGGALAPAETGEVEASVHEIDIALEAGILREVPEVAEATEAKAEKTKKGES